MITLFSWNHFNIYKNVSQDKTPAPWSCDFVTQEWNIATKLEAAKCIWCRDKENEYRAQCNA